MFIGEYNYSLDDKARVSIPAKFRASLTEGAVVTRGLDNCLFVYTKDEWVALAEKVSSMPIGKADSRAFSRLILAGAMDVALDKQGRIVLPDYLRQFAGINKKVVLAGLYNRLEIWDEEKWNAYKLETERTGNDIAEKLGEIGV